MLGVFERQIRDGGPITVTHPEVSRYFMTSEEAIALTIQAGAIGDPGEVLVLDMGEPVRIAEVATRLAEQASSTVPIVYTGLRPGEKLHEVLLGAGEADVRPTHPLISQVPVPPLRFDDARRRVLGRRPAGALGRLAGGRRRVGVGRSGRTVVVHHDGGR